MSDRIVEQIEIEKLAQGGDGFARLPDGRVLFVEGAYPKDVVDVEIAKEKETWARGGIAELRRESPGRVSVECEAFERGCGGCQFWDVDYESELAWKVDAAVENIERIGGVDLPEASVVEAPSMRDYRSRMTFHQRQIDGEMICGLFEEGTHRVVEIEGCPVARPEIDEAMAELRDVLASIGELEVTFETAGRGEAVALIELSHGERIEHADLEELARRIEQGTVVRGVEIVDKNDEYFVIGNTTVAAEEVLARPPAAGLHVESGRFRQVNAEVNRRLASHVTDLVEQTGEAPRILELFCGAGNLSFSLAESIGELTGVDDSEGAIETARRIAELAELDEKMGFRTGDLTSEDVVTDLLEAPFDVLLLDPPRKGAATVAECLRRMRVGGRIVYVSCDPACLARDAEMLEEGGWEIEELVFYDMFPRTSHIEAVMVLDG